MLVLTRKPNEEIVINGNIRVRVLGVHGGRIRLGIDAPTEIAVRRSELEYGDVRRDSAMAPEHPGAVTLAAG
jgi:carbon storage regulator